MSIENDLFQDMKMGATKMVMPRVYWSVATNTVEAKDRRRCLQLVHLGFNLSS